MAGVTKPVQAGFTILTASQDLTGCIQVPGALETEYEKWKDAVNLCPEIAVTGAVLWYSTKDRHTTVGPNASQIATYKKGIIKYDDDKEHTRFEGKMSAKEVAEIEKISGKIGTRTITLVAVL